MHVLAQLHKPHFEYIFGYMLMYIRMRKFRHIMQATLPRQAHKCVRLSRGRWARLHAAALRAGRRTTDATMLLQTALQSTCQTLRSARGSGRSVH